MDILIVAFLGYILGAIGRTAYDWLWKALAEPDFKFDSKYIASMLISIILSFITASVTFSTVTLPAGSEFYVLLASVSQGYLMTDVVNKPISYLSKKAEADGK
jgi:H+/Cl- antiporter ClcA